MAEVFKKWITVGELKILLDSFPDEMIVVSQLHDQKRYYIDITPVQTKEVLKHRNRYETDHAGDYIYADAYSGEKGVTVLVLNYFDESPELDDIEDDFYPY